MKEIRHKKQNLALRGWSIQWVISGILVCKEHHQKISPHPCKMIESCDNNDPSRRRSDQDPEDPEGPDDDDSSADDSAAAADDLVKVWDGGKLIQTVNEKGNKIVKCLHGCGGIRRSWNRTKALGHVLGGCGDIKRCKTCI